MNGNQTFTFEDHAAYADDLRRKLLYELRQELLRNYGELKETVTLGNRVAYNFPGGIQFLEIKVNRSSFNLHMIDTGRLDPEQILEQIPETHEWGAFTKRARIHSSKGLQEVLPFVEAACRHSFL